MKIFKKGEKEHDIADTKFEIIAKCPHCYYDQRVQFISRYKKYPKKHKCVLCHGNFVYFSPSKKTVYYKFK